MNPFLIAGLLGAGAGFLSRDKKKSRKKMARGGRLDERAIKEKLDDIGVEYEKFLEEGADLDEIQNQHLGFIYDSDTNTWSSFKGARNIYQLSRPSNTYKTPVSQKVQDSAEEFAYLLDSVLRALSLPHVKTYGWNGSSFGAVGSYDYYIGKGDDFDERTRDLIRRDYHDNVEEVLKFVCEMTGAVLEEYDREAPNITGSVAGVDIDAMVEAQENRRAELRKKFGFARGGRLDEEAIKDKLYDMGVDYDELMEQGEDLDAIQDQYLGYRYDSDTNTWSYAKGGVSAKNMSLDTDMLDVFADQFSQDEQAEIFEEVTDVDSAIDYLGDVYDMDKDELIKTGILRTQKAYAKGGKTDEDILVVDVVWRQLNEKGLGKFRLKESDVERLEDDYGSTYYFEPYDYTNEKPISYSKMKNILDKSMKEMGLMDSIFAKGGKTDEALERTLSRFRAIREGSERRDAQARQRRRLRQHQTGMSAGAFAKGGVTGSYWDNKGKYQKEYEKAFELLVPSTGEADAGLPEALRGISRIGYEYFNNGMMNLWNCYQDGYYEEWDGEEEWIDTEECEIDRYYEDLIESVQAEIPYSMGRELEEFIKETEGGNFSEKDVIIDRILDHIMEKIKDSGLIDDDNFAKGGKVKGLDKYGAWYYMDDDGTLFVRAQEVGQDKAPKWDEDDDEWGVVDSRAFGTMERQEFDRDMKKLFGRKPKLG